MGGESHFEVCEWYKELMGSCTHNELDKWLIIHTFYNGLLYNIRITIDTATDGALMNKPFNDAYTMIENMAQNHYLGGVNVLL